MSTIRAGSKVRVLGQVVSVRGESLAVRVGDSLVNVHISEAQTADRNRYYVTDVDFDESRIAISKNIRAARHRANLSQSELADRLGLTQASVSQWELGASAPRFHVLPLLAKTLGTTVEDLCGVN